MNVRIVVELLALMGGLNAQQKSTLQLLKVSEGEIAIMRDAVTGRVGAVSLDRMLQARRLFDAAARTFSDEDRTGTSASMRVRAKSGRIPNWVPVYLECHPGAVRFYTTSLEEGGEYACRAPGRREPLGRVFGELLAAAGYHKHAYAGGTTATVGGMSPDGRRRVLYSISGQRGEVTIAVTYSSQRDRSLASERSNGEAAVDAGGK
jgi:hypothetical protein